MPIGTGGPRGRRGHETTDFGGPTSRLHEAEIRHKKIIFSRFLKNYLAGKFNQTLQAHTMVNAHCITTIPMQKSEGQGYTRPKLHLKAG